MLSPQCPTCPSVPALTVIESSPAHLTHLSTLAGPGRARIRPVMRGGQRRRWSCPGFPLPFGDRRWLLGSSCARWGVGPSSRSAYRVLSHPDPNGVSTFHTSEIRPGWVPPKLRDGDALPADVGCSAGACRFTTASPAPHWFFPSAGLTITKHHQGFTHVHPSGLPLACSSRMEREPLGFSSGLHTPPLPATHARVGTGPEHWPGTILSTSTVVLLRVIHSIVRPRVAPQRS